MLQSFFPKSNFMADVQTNPDLYGTCVPPSVLPSQSHRLMSVPLLGPFWVATTVVFLMFVTGNIAQSIAAYAAGQPNDQDYNFTQLSLAAGAVYGYAFGVPLLWRIVLGWWWKCEGVKLLEMVCLYGYAMSSLIPVSVGTSTTHRPIVTPVVTVS